MAKFEARADTLNNRLYVTLAGFSDDAQMRRNVDQVIAQLPKLRPGFVMISTITEMRATSAGGARELERAMQAYKRHGISRIVRIVRIVGEEVLGKLQLQRLANEAGIPVAYATSQEGAEALLRAKPAKPAG
jgi:hypothetical protein